MGAEARFEFVEGATGDLTFVALLPVSTSGKPCTVLRWRWDRREIPWPFACVTVRVGDPIQVPVGLPPDERAEWCKHVEAALDALDSVSGAPARAMG